MIACWLLKCDAIFAASIADVTEDSSKREEAKLTGDLSNDFLEMSEKDGGK